MIVKKTGRLILRQLTINDADFILKLVNEPSWLQFIGDRGVHTNADAQNYILQGPVNSYERLGFGLYLVELKENRIPIGICGLIKRDALQDVDIGFAFLPEYWGKGYGFEAASAVLALGKKKFGLKRIVAVTNPDNARSIRLLEKLGLHFKQMVRIPPDSSEIELFSEPENSDTPDFH
jgi:RimJ/RimL family protein N-acetyltransferase